MAVDSVLLKFWPKAYILTITRQSHTKQLSNYKMEIFHLIFFAGDSEFDSLIGLPRKRGHGRGNASRARRVSRGARASRGGRATRGRGRPPISGSKLLQKSLGISPSECHICKLPIESDDTTVSCNCYREVHDDCYRMDGDGCQ